MKLKLQRIFRGDKYTIGKFYIDNVYFCDSLEDTCRIINGDCSMKIYGQTAIPEGDYHVEYIWWDKHQKFYPHIKDVPCFTGIMIHSGINQDDTEGCILLGVNDVKGQLHNGLIHMDRLRNKLKDEKNITIEIW